ncbi:MAG: hypothetical protein DWQ01_16905 [Planctomycetota bacterium]|nr:MAG: hypothetical protein DWQ01_16905 [Planctomycetota bacterium]
MSRKSLEVRCPCCETLIRIDPATGAILGHGDRPKDLGEAVRRAEDRDLRSEDVFAQALKAERNRQAELDALFQKAQDKARDQDDDKAPDNPLDDRWR